MARAANHHFDNHHDSHIGIKWLETDVKVILVLTFYLQKHFNDYWGSKRQFAIDFHVSEFVLEFLLKIRTFENGENKKLKILSFVGWPVILKLKKCKSFKDNQGKMTK